MPKKTPKQDVDAIIKEFRVASTNPINAAEHPPETPQGTKTISDILKIGEKLFKDLASHVKEKKEKFTDLPDKDKMEEFQKLYPEYNEFIAEQPLVAKMAICVGQFSLKALERMLQKTSKLKHPPVDKQPKDYNRDQLMRRQADYRRYWWEERHGKHYNNEEAKRVWNEAYMSLKGDFDDFRDKYKQIEEKTKQDAEKFKAENVKDLVERLKTGKQHLSEEKTKEFIDLIQKHLEDAKNRKPEPKKPKDDKPTITMIEYVDENRIDEVPEELVVRPEDLEKIAKYESIE